MKKKNRKNHLTTSPGRIRVLATAVANQLAAGEVVERPASAVKELVENAIDAGAKKIEIEIEGGGIGRIRVTDDGCGIAKEDLPLALVRHATSKIETAAELFEVLTLGFRGEALASLAAIAKLTLTSRPPGEETAWQVSDADREPRPVRGDPGTVVEAHDLFHSVPARRRFLRKGSTEAGHVAEAVRRAAMACPNVEFELRHNGRRTLRARTGEHRIADLFSAQIAASAVPIARRGENMALRGWIGAGPKEEHVLIVNGRTVRDRSAMHAVKSAIEGRWTAPGQPVSVVEITVDPRLVDVNAHPSKLEVRWSDARTMHGLVASAIRAGVEGRLPVSVPTRETHGVPAREDPGELAFRSEGAATPVGEKESGPGAAPSDPPRRREPGPWQSRPAGRGSAVPAREQHPVECIVLGEDLAIAKEGDQLLVIDIGAGAEAMVRELAVAAGSGGRIESSPLLVPTTVPGGQEGFDPGRREELARYGVSLREGLNGTWIVLEVPAVLKGTDVAQWTARVLRETGIPVDEILAEAAREQAVASAETVRRILSSKAARKVAAGTVDRERLRKVAGLDNEHGRSATACEG